MSSFLFDILPVDADIELTLQLANLLNREGHAVYYTDSSDSVFTTYLLKKGIGRILYPGDLRWFQPDLVLLDKRLDARSAFYRQKEISIVCVGLLFADKQKASKECPLLFLAASPLDYEDLSNDWLVCAGPLLDTEKQKESILSKREALLANRLNQTKQQDSKLPVFVVADMSEESKDKFRFYELVKEFCVQNTQFEIVLCASKKGMINELFPLPANMQYYSSEKSRELIACGDIVVTNGDLDMLIGCVYHSLPALLIPVTEKQAENSARIVYHGLGLKIEQESLTIENLSRHIEILKNSRASMTLRIEEMRELFDRKSNQAHYVINWLEEYADNNKKER